MVALDIIMLNLLIGGMWLLLEPERPYRQTRTKVAISSRVSGLLALIVVLSYFILRYRSF
jgi:hypothetical protein